MAKTKITNLMVVRVYSGAPGCACGCRGSYSTSSKSINRILNLYERTPEDKVETTSGLDGQMIAFWDREDGKRTYTIYYREVG